MSYNVLSLLSSGSGGGGGGGGDGGVTVVGNLDAQTKNSKGLTIVENIIYAQSANTIYPGLINTDAQDFSGLKGFQQLRLRSGDGFAQYATFNVPSLSGPVGINVPPANSTLVQSVSIPTAGQFVTNIDENGVQQFSGLPSGTRIFKGLIEASSDFPTLAEVQNGWEYKINTAFVIDNDPTKTNTGTLFYGGTRIYWDTTLTPNRWSTIGNISNVNGDVTNRGLIMWANEQGTLVQNIPGSYVDGDNALNVQGLVVSSLLHVKSGGVSFSGDNTIFSTDFVNIHPNTSLSNYSNIRRAFVIGGDLSTTNFNITAFLLNTSFTINPTAGSTPISEARMMSVSANLALFNNLTTFYGILISPGTAAGSGSVTNAYGMYIDQPGFGTGLRYSLGVATLRVAQKIDILNDLNFTDPDCQMTVKSGANQICGNVTLVAGQATVNNTNITEECEIQLSYKITSGTLGHLVCIRVPGTSFVVQSRDGGNVVNTADVSTISYLIIKTT